MKDITGKEVSFTDAQKKNGMLVMFSCNTCPVVKKYQSRTLAAAAYAAKNDIGVVLLNSNEGTRDDGDSFDDMKSYGKRQGYNFFYVLDDKSSHGKCIWRQPYAGSVSHSIKTRNWSIMVLSMITSMVKTG